MYTWQNLVAQLIPKTVFYDSRLGAKITLHLAPHLYLQMKLLPCIENFSITLDYKF